MNGTHRSLLRLLLILAFFIATPTPNSAHNAIVTDGDLDPSFGVGGKVITPLQVSHAFATALALQTDGKLVAAGFAAGQSNSDFALVRYSPGGSLDASFGSGGTITTDVGAGDRASALAVQRDGKIVAAGVSGASCGDFCYTASFALVRYNSDGSLDSGFGNAGKVLTDAGVSGGAQAVAIQSDGKLLVAGGISGDARHIAFTLLRYNGDGSLDTTFGMGGRVITDFGSSGSAAAVVLQPDGKIIAAGDPGMARYTIDGSLDSSFGNGGRVISPVTWGGLAQALAIQADGKIVTAGSYNSDFVLVRYNNNGSLDTAFGIEGKVTTDFGNSDSASALGIQPNGKLVAAGTTFDSTGIIDDFALARYNTDGSLDGNFGNGGKATTDFGASDRATALVIQANSEFVTAGSTTDNSSSQFALVRHTGNGAVDTSFGRGGQVITGVVSPYQPGEGRGYAVAIQADGKVVILGTVGGDLVLARYNPDGSLDASFGSEGRVITKNILATAVALQSNGKIVVTGTASNTTYTGSFFVLARYNLDGTLDDGFGTGGIVLTDFPGANEGARAIVVQADGKVVVAGGAAPTGGPTFALARYQADGTLDSSFGGGGKVLTDFGGSSGAGAIAILPDRRIVAAGTAMHNRNNDFALAVYNSDGRLDSNFGNGGKVLTDFGGADDGASAITIQWDSKIVAAGTTTPNQGLSDFALARYNADGSLDSGFGNAGKVTQNFGDSDSASSLALQPDGKLVVAGWASNYPQIMNFALSRYNTDGSLDSGFGIGGLQTINFSGTDSASGLAIQTDGKLIVAGTSNGNLALARIIITLHCTTQFADVPPSNPFYPYISCLAGQGVINGYANCTFRPVASVTRGQFAKFVANAAAYTDTIPSTVQTFTDVPSTDPFWLYIERAAVHGVISGYSNGDGTFRFRPTASVTRGQASKFVANAAHFTDAIPATQQTFSDVPPADPFWLYIERVKAHGVIAGYADGTFHPREAVRRGQTAKFIANALIPSCQMSAP